MLIFYSINNIKFEIDFFAVRNKIKPKLKRKGTDLISFIN